MATTKLVLLFAALFVASVSGDAVQDNLNNWLQSFDNITQKLGTEIRQFSADNSKEFDALNTQLQSFASNVTDILNTVKNKVATEFDQALSQKINVSIESIGNDIRSKFEEGTALTPEKLKEKWDEGLQTLNSQIHNLTTSLQANIQDVGQTLKDPLDNLKQAVETVAQKVQTSVQQAAAA